jgi:hypothetical protein
MRLRILFSQMGRRHALLATFFLSLCANQVTNGQLRTAAERRGDMPVDGEYIANTIVG